MKGNKNSYLEKRFGLSIEKNKKNLFLKSLCIIFVAIIIIAIAVIVPKTIQCSISQLTISDDLNATWLGSIASYWGGVIGGIISGTLTVIGVTLTIKYYKKSDKNNKRVEFIPFIEIKLVGNKMAGQPNLSKTRIIEKHSRIKEIDKSKIVFLDLELENIGRSFASILALHIGQDFGGVAYNELIKVGDKTHMELGVYIDDISKGDSISFVIQYIDCMTNEYVQEYTIRKDKKIIIENGYPKFIGQTHSI